MQITARNNGSSLPSSFINMLQVTQNSPDMTDYNLQGINVNEWPTSNQLNMQDYLYPEKTMCHAN